MSPGESVCLLQNALPRDRWRSARRLSPPSSPPTSQNAHACHCHLSPKTALPKMEREYIRGEREREREENAPAPIEKHDREREPEAVSRQVCACPRLEKQCVNR